MNPSEIRLRTTLYFGPGAVGRMEDILGRYRRRGARRVGIVTGTKSHILSGAWGRVEEALEKNDMGDSGDRRGEPHRCIKGRRGPS